ncbi:hypothetical protein A2716_02335 [candidate division WWE3 bacterium RIFCSPHIGHO2_01_FULL_40_23]|uniref:Uncharacterized protein n=1 Tax=candidate division WWE3 bacterium RIFCSPLOWO2_01_FULL_41_18 TaxID=1802625 RepID=A0A1F4VGG8_UNCKA|nr:MAG: hypothetical protein A2716_02335 [candidate division WWE3 bacterium RIFCSPHIGHO2_01_FULL_40_23]OGC55823.1 MAG: hypothetical protein A3A78_02185 [candidate division WWE3 bacterium RIFCSPLOWO2_01_FULL_41_18]
MIKRILRTGLGIVFLFVFLLFLLVGAFKFRVLSSKLWKTSLEKGGVYQQLQDQITKMRTGLEDAIRKESGGKDLPPEVAKELAPFLSLDKVLSADRFKELAETNIDRLFDYLNGKDKDLILYLPVAEWELPVQTFGQPALAKLTAQTPAKDALPLLGIKPEQTKLTMDGLEQARTIVGYLTPAWVILLLLMVVMGLGHYFLGVGPAGRISGTAWLIMISGFTAALIGFSAGGIFEFMAANSQPPMPSWGIELGKSLVEQFFNFGAMVGLGAGIAGLVTIVAVMYFIKQGKIKQEKEAIGTFKKILSFVIGIILGFMILVAALVVTGVAIGGKVSLKANGGSVDTGSQPVEEDTTK